MDGRRCHDSSVKRRWVRLASARDRIAAIRSTVKPSPIYADRDHNGVFGPKPVLIAMSDESPSAAMIPIQLPTTPELISANILAVSKFRPTPRTGAYPIHSRPCRELNMVRAIGTPLTTTRLKNNVALNSSGHTGSDGFNIGALVISADGSWSTPTCVGTTATPQQHRNFTQVEGL